jgi:hypothetical protein
MIVTLGVWAFFGIPIKNGFLWAWRKVTNQKTPA